jgi:hypothetical protein
MIEIVSEAERLIISKEYRQLILSPNPKLIRDADEKNDYLSEMKYELLNKERPEKLNGYSKTGIRNHISILLDLPLLGYWEYITEILKYDE